MPDSAVLYAAADGVARITLNRPESLNSWNEQLGIELHYALEPPADDDAVRAVLITGAGRAFSSGADLSEQRAGVEGEPPDLSERLLALYNPIILAVRELPKPVLAAVNGPAAGIGCSLALACDLIVAAESAFFLLAFVNIGLVPDGGTTATVPVRAGAARAAEMAMLGERIRRRARPRVGPDQPRRPRRRARSAAADLLVHHLAHGPTQAYANIKRLLNRTLYPDLAEQLDAEAAAQREQGRTATSSRASSPSPRNARRGSPEPEPGAQSPSSACPGGSAPVWPGGLGLPGLVPPESFGGFCGFGFSDPPVGDTPAPA